MGALNQPLAILLAALLSVGSGCALPSQMTGYDRAMTVYRESLDTRGQRSFQREQFAHRGAKQRIGEETPRVLTVETAIEMAKKNSAHLAALQARAAEAEAKIAAADRRKNPELRVSQLRLDQLLDGGAQVRTAIRFSPDRPGSISADIAEARTNHAEKQAEMLAEEMALEADVRWLFDELALLDSEIAAARAIAENRQSLATQMKARLTASEATSIDEAMAELSAVEADAELTLQRVRRSDVLDELFDRIGIEPGASVEVIVEQTLVWPPPDLPPEQALIEEALRRRPEIMAAAVRIDAADARTFAERGKRFPWFSFFEVGYESAPGTKTGLGWTFQAGLELPIFDTNRAGVVASDAAKNASLRIFEDVVERVVRDVRSRLREVHAARALVTEFRARALPIADRAGHEARHALEGRNIDTIRALTVDERRVVVDIRLLRLVRRHRLAMAELRRAVGGSLLQRGNRISGSVSSAVTP